MNSEIDKLKKEIELIKQRNSKVESDKAWETSNFRKLTICVLTYFVMCLLMYSIGVKDFYINAVIPTAGFFLSTLSVPILKKWWMQNRK